MIHDFHERNTWSLSQADEPFWEAFYRIAFPNMATMELCTRLDWQLRGVDRVLRLDNDRIVLVDEKKRQRDYNDILLEYTSNDRRNTPGWIEKNLAIDYLAYAFMPTRRVFLYPWPLLRRAWVANGTQWKGEYYNTAACNNGYTTRSVCVPINVLTKAVNDCMVINVPPIEDQP